MINQRRSRPRTYTVFRQCLVLYKNLCLPPVQSLYFIDSLFRTILSHWRRSMPRTYSLLSTWGLVQQFVTPSSKTPLVYWMSAQNGCVTPERKQPSRPPSYTESPVNMRSRSSTCDSLKSTNSYRQPMPPPPPPQNKKPLPAPSTGNIGLPIFVIIFKLTSTLTSWINYL